MVGLDLTSKRATQVHLVQQKMSPYATVADRGDSLRSGF